MQLQINTLLQGGKYRIVRFINSGGFGCTYEAEHVMLEKRVAIKEFFVKDFCNRDEATAHVTVGTLSKKGLVEKLRRKFVDEARAICKLHHPGIVTVSDVFEENGTAYFVMDYIEGRSLSQMVSQEGPLTEERALHYIRQVAGALDYVHSHNRLHLDVKPGNIMVDSSDRAILIDFGASKQYDEQDGENTSTLVGKTPGYAPLEQMGNDVVKFLPSTDIYALGATLYKLLTGTTPLSANLLASGEELAPLPDGISSSTRQAIAAAMQVNKNKRPQSIKEFLSLLADEEESTVIVEPVKPQSEPVPKPTSAPEPNPAPIEPVPGPVPSLWKKWAIPLVAGVVAVLAVVLWPKGDENEPAVVVNEISAPQQKRLPQVKDSISHYGVIGEETSAPSLLYVTTSPSGATVYVDGKKVGTSPIEGKEVSRGRHTIKISKSGYESISETEQFEDKPVMLNHTLSVDQAVLEEQREEQALAEQKAKEEEERKAQALAEQKAKEEEERRAQVLAEQKAKEEAELKAKSSSPTGTINGHGYVDLGLSVKWAYCNVGANSPSDYGSYFAWGETSTKSEYTQENCVNYGKKRNDISGKSKYDAARANWGGSWRMPTLTEIKDLKNKCKWVWTTQGGHNGYKVTGPNGNSIFLPAVGSWGVTGLYSAGSRGYYWSATPYSDNYGAYYLSFGSGDYDWSHYYRDNGYAVRPVTDGLLSDSEK